MYINNYTLMNKNKTREEHTDTHAHNTHAHTHTHHTQNPKRFNKNGKEEWTENKGIASSA